MTFAAMASDPAGAASDVAAQNTSKRVGAPTAACPDRAFPRLELGAFGSRDVDIFKRAVILRVDHLHWRSNEARRARISVFVKQTGERFLKEGVLEGEAETFKYCGQSYAVKLLKVTSGNSVALEIYPVP